MNRKVEVGHSAAHLKDVGRSLSWLGFFRELCLSVNSSEVAHHVALNRDAVVVWGSESMKNGI